MSLHQLSPIFINIPVGYILDLFGRKKGMLFCAAPLLAGWVITLFAKSLELLYTARIIAGLGVAFANVVSKTFYD